MVKTVHFAPARPRHALRGPLATPASQSSAPPRGGARRRSAVAVLVRCWRAAAVGCCYVAVLAVAFRFHGFTGDSARRAVPSRIGPATRRYPAAKHGHAKTATPNILSYSFVPPRTPLTRQLRTVTTHDTYRTRPWIRSFCSCPVFAFVVPCCCPLMPLLDQSTG
jgi:hypothetical protein